jgi:hypothetical protein
MTYIAIALRRLVAERANYRCEYCLIHEDDSLFSHEIDHVIAVKHGGGTVDANLCYCCYVCNRNKGSDIASVDPTTLGKAFLFSPREDVWGDHFRFDKGNIEGITPMGRATVAILGFNEDDRVEARLELIEQGRYP